MIPKDVRDRLRLKAGDKLEIVENIGGITLRRVETEERISLEEFDRRMAPIRAKIRGPAPTLEEIDRSIEAAVLERAKRKGW